MKTRKLSNPVHASQPASQNGRTRSSPFPSREATGRQFKGRSHLNFSYALSPRTPSPYHLPIRHRLGCHHQHGQLVQHCANCAPRRQRLGRFGRYSSTHRCHAACSVRSSFEFDNLETPGYLQQCIQQCIQLNGTGTPTHQEEWLDVWIICRWIGHRATSQHPRPLACGTPRSGARVGRPVEQQQHMALRTSPVVAYTTT